MDRWSGRRRARGAKRPHAPARNQQPPSGAELENAKLGKTLHPNVQIRHTASGDWVVKGRNGKRAAVENEAVASALAQDIGLNVPQVHHIKMYGQDQAVVQVVHGTDLSKMTPEHRKAALAKVPKPDIDKHALFDFLLGSADPNLGNYMIGKGGELIALDKEQSLRLGSIGDKASGRAVLPGGPDSVGAPERLPVRAGEREGDGRRRAEDGREAETSGAR